jgi:hypothetical protein
MSASWLAVCPGLGHDIGQDFPRAQKLLRGA